MMCRPPRPPRRSICDSGGQISHLRAYDVRAPHSYLSLRPTLIARRLCIPRHAFTLSPWLSSPSPLRWLPSCMRSLWVPMQLQRVRTPARRAAGAWHATRFPDPASTNVVAVTFRSANLTTCSPGYSCVAINDSESARRMRLLVGGCSRARRTLIMTAPCLDSVDMYAGPADAYFHREDWHRHDSRERCERRSSVGGGVREGQSHVRC